MVIPEPDDVSDEDFTAVNPSSPAGLSPSAEQRSRSRREERSRSRERVPAHSSSHASQQSQSVVPPGVSQTRTLATEALDEDSATVDPQNRVNNRSRRPQKQKGEKTVAEISRVTYRRPTSTSPWIQMRKMQNLKRPGTSSTSQPTDPVLLYHQGQAENFQGPTVLDNSADENSEFCDEYSAQSRDSERTLYYPVLYVLTNDEHWTMTPETQV